MHPLITSMAGPSDITMARLIANGACRPAKTLSLKELRYLGTRYREKSEARLALATLCAEWPSGLRRHELSSDLAANSAGSSLSRGSLLRACMRR